MCKIISNRYRAEKNKSPYLFFLGFNIGYSKKYVYWLEKQVANEK